MEKQVITAGVPETGGPFNLAVKYGNLIFISGLPPFDESYSSALREARRAGRPIPTFPDMPFEKQVRIVMDHLKKLVEERNANVAKFNKLAAEYNDLVNKWNKQQEEISKGATNAPPKK